MKTIVSGKLAETPEITEVELNDGSKQRVANFTIFVFDGNAPLRERKDGSRYREGIPLKCTAWGELADQVGEFKKGEQFTASATMRHNAFERKDGSRVVEPKYMIRRIDKENDIQKQISNLLSHYEEGKTDHIFKEEEQPSFSKDIAKDLNMAEPAPEKDQAKVEPEKEA